MEKTTTVVAFRQVDSVDDPLTELAREGARRMLAEALKAEADAFVAQFADLELPDGRQRVVRHGHGPTPTIQTGVGPLEVQRAKVRDRADVGIVERVGSGFVFPKVDTDERLPIRRNAVVFPDQARDTLIGGRTGLDRLDQLSSWWCQAAP